MMFLVDVNYEHNVKTLYVRNIILLLKLQRPTIVYLVRNNFLFRIDYRVGLVLNNFNSVYNYVKEKKTTLNVTWITTVKKKKK